MVALRAASSTITLLYFLIYSSTIALIICPLIATHIQPPNNETTSSPAPFKTTTALLLLSIGGLPPLIGFLPKLLAIHLLSHFSPTAVILVLILGSLASLYFYITLTLALFYSPLSTPHTNPTNPRALPPALRATTLLYLAPLLLLIVT
jgi:NADH-ubiquinone oxidoreductase chain 2